MAWRALKDSLPLIGVSAASIIVIITVLSVPLAGGQAMGLSPAELATWIAGLYGISSVLGIFVTLLYHQPLALTSTFAAIVLVATVGDQFAYSDLGGAFVLSGVLVLVLGLVGVTRRLAWLVPAPIVLGMLAGAILPFVVGIFTLLEDATHIGVAVLLAYLASRWMLGARPIAVIPAVITGIAAAAVGGDLGNASVVTTIPDVVVTLPTFSIQAILAVTPVVIVLMTAQANIPSMVLLRSNGYMPPDRMLDALSGVATVFASFFGPIAISLSVPLTALIAGSDGGEPNRRHRAIYVVYSAALLIALLAGATAALVAFLPHLLLIALAGLAMFGVFTSSLQHMVEGPLTIGPVFAFAVVVSGVSLFGLGAFFWALVIGVGVSLLFERKGMATLRERSRMEG